MRTLLFAILFGVTGFGVGAKEVQAPGVPPYTCHAGLSRVGLPLLGDKPWCAQPLSTGGVLKPIPDLRA